MSGRFKKLIKGKTEIEIAGEKFELDVNLEDKQEILDLRKQDFNLVKMAEIFKRIFKRSYPEEPEEDISKFVEENILDILTELTIAFRWATREQLKKAIEETQGKLESR